MTSMQIPVQRALWLPGEGVRGYDFVTDMGNIAAVANLELRVPLLPFRDVQVRRLGTLKQVQLAAFADVGTVHKSAPGWVLRGGLGLGVRVPVVAFGSAPMVLRFDAAQGLTRGGKLNSYVLLTAPELF
jgi:hemolysin activation/secretion protein